MTREKEINIAASKYIEDNSLGGEVRISSHKDSFIEGAEWADNNPETPWIKWKDKKPKVGIEIIAYNKHWIDKDFNPNGIRIGFLCGDIFVSAYWRDDQDCYMTIDRDICNENPTFYADHIGNTEPEYWFPIPRFVNPLNNRR